MKYCNIVVIVTLLSLSTSTVRVIISAKIEKSDETTIVDMQIKQITQPTECIVKSKIGRAS